MMRRLRETLPVWIVTLTWGVAQHTWTIFLASLAILALASTIGFRRYDIGLGRQRLITIFALAAGWTAASIDFASLDPKRRFAEVVLRVCIATTFAAIVRLTFRNGERGSQPVFVLCAMALLSCGQPATLPVYAVGSTFFVIASVIAMSPRTEATPSFAKALRIRSISMPAMLGILSTAAGLAVVFVVLFHKAHGVIQRRIEAYLGGAHASNTGFADRMNLGGMGPMLKSDTVVLRVYGLEADYLRGIVYSTYRRGEWSEDVEPEVGVKPPSPLMPASLDRVSTVYDTYLVHAFVPLSGCDVYANVESHVDAVGIVRAVSDRFLDRVDFRTRCERPDFPLRAGNSGDTMFPGDLRPVLSETLRSWHIEGSPRERLRALEAHFHEHFTYALGTEHPGEPISNFLRVNREGHCEYFASAMVLLARMAGIPARVVGGYRVSERAPFGDYFVVRERDAHAWVEAYVDGAWRSYDPTPVDTTASAFRRVGFASAARELVRGAATVVWSKIVTHARVVLVAAVAAVALVFAFTRLRNRGVRARVTTTRNVARFAELSATLERLGERREPWETLGSFADRVRKIEAAWGSEAAELVERYGRLRYGGVGNEEELSRAVSDFVTRPRVAPDAGERE